MVSSNVARTNAANGAATQTIYTSISLQIVFAFGSVY